MKKTFFALSVFALVLCGAQSLFAQSTPGSLLYITNNTDCSVRARGIGFDRDCKKICFTADILVPGGATVSAPFVCVESLESGFVFLGVRILDQGSSELADVGTGCGLSLCDSYADCDDVSRTACITAANTVVIN